MRLLELITPYLALGVFAVVFLQMFREMRRQRGKDQIKDLENEIVRRKLQEQLEEIDRKKRGLRSAECSDCGGNNSPDAISPHGDVKCSYCGNWFNIRD